MIAAPLFTFPANAQPAYTPGVKAGDSVTFGKIVAIWRSNSTPPSFIQLYNQSKSIQETVTSISGNVVSLREIFNFANGTRQSVNGTIDVQSGGGYFGDFLLAGGLSAGDQIYQPQYPYQSYPVITETVTRLYAGALRTINVVNETYGYGGQRILFDWDANSGFLLDLVDSVSDYAYSFVISFKVTSTNVWPPSGTPDFGFDVMQQSSSPLFIGQTGTFRFSLNSTNSFTGTIGLKPALLNSTQHGPTLSLSLSSVSLSAGQSNSSILEFSTNSTTPVGAYIFSVNGTSGSLSHIDTILVNVLPPDFGLVAHPASLTIAAGSSKTSTITISSLGSFSGNILLSTQTFNAITATVQPANIALTSTTSSANATLTVSVPSGTPPSPYNSVYVTGRSSSLTHQVYLPINVTGPDFRISANPSLLNLKPGATAQSTITLSSVLGFSGTIFLSASAYQISASLDKSSVFVNSTTTATAKLTVTVPSNAPAEFVSIYITGSSINLTRSAYVEVSITAPDFIMTINPSFFTLNKGSNATATINLASSLGWHGTVSLNAYDYSTNGPKITINPSSVTLTANGTATAKLTISTLSANPGNYYIEVVGTGGSLSHAFYVYVTVIGPDFSITASPNILTIKPGGSAKSTISLSSLQHFNGTITLSTSSYYQVTATLDKTTVSVNSTTPATATLTVTVGGTTPAGYYTVNVYGVSGNLTHTTNVNVDVIAPSFSISTSPSYVSLKQDSSINATITVESLVGFHGTVSLSATVYSMNGPTFSIIPSIVSLTANGTATATLTISTFGSNPGYYYVSITGNSGNLYEYGFIAVNVVGPDFSMSPNPSYINLIQGNSATSIVTISRIDNFNGTITLSSYYYGPSQELTVTFNSTSVTLSSSVTSVAVNVTITASTSAAPGYYNVYTNGTSGPLSRYGFIQVNVSARPDFDIFATPSADFNSGAQGTSIITIDPRYGFTGKVSLTSSPSPSTGLSVNCPSSVTVTGSAPINATCTLTSTTPGSYSIEIVATSGSLVHNTTFVSYVGDFTISLKSPVDFDSGSSGQALVSLTSTNKLVGNITLAGSGSGLMVSCPSVAVPVSADASVETACSVTGTVAGTYQVTITGTASPGTLSHSTTATLHIGDFAISASSGSFNTGTSGTSITISLASTFNFAGAVSLGSSVSPSTGLTVDCPANAIPLSPNSTSTTSCILSSTSPATYQIIIAGKATIGTSSHDASSFIHVGDFAISIASVDVNSGSNETMSISLTSINNFAGPILLSGSTLAGLTVTCPDTPISIMLNATINTSCLLSSRTPGTYSVTVAGTSITGAASHSASGLTHVGDFTISIATPNNFELGGPDELITVSLTSKLDFAGTIVLTPSTTPDKGVKVICPALTLTANSSSSADCTFRADNAGTYLVAITGNNLPGTGSHATSVVVEAVDFTVSASGVSPSSFAVGTTGTSSITIAPVNGFNGTATLAATSPSGIACNFDRTTIQADGTSTLSCTSNAAGDYKVIVTAIEGSTFHQTSLTFHVTTAPAPSNAATLPTMFGLQLPIFFGLVGAVIVAITIVGVSVAVRRSRP